MNNEDNNLDLLDLDDAESVDALPEVPFREGGIRSDMDKTS